MKEKAIEKINAEVQKNPDNKYIEVIGQYIIDQCENEEMAKAVLAEGKTLAGCLDAIKAIAKKKAVDNVGVVTEEEAFAEVHKYFGVSKETGAKAAVSIDLDKFLI